MRMLSPCTSVLEPIEDILWNGPGLNLTTNNGLDLSLTTYEGLNLSQSGQDAVLNLTSSGPPVAASTQGQNQGQDGSQGGVGLNLSLQNGMNLTTQSSYYYSAGDHQYNNCMIQQPPPQQTGQTYQTLENGTRNALQSTEQNRNSPLNLEHRTSPLNLTSVQQQKFDAQNYYYDYSQQTYQMNQDFNQNGGDIYQPNGANGQMMFQQPNFDDVNGIQQQQNKIRLFCSSCNNQEFNTTAELNKHMERHNNGIESDPSVSVKSADNLMQSINLTSCVHCQAEFTDEASLLKHQKFHTSGNGNWEIETGLQNYDLSDIPSTSGYDTTTNTNVKNAKIPKYPESLKCNQELSDKQPLSETPNAEKPHKCEDCLAKFLTYNSLRRHRERTHRKVAPKHVCCLCNKGFYDKRDLLRHEKSHQPKKGPKKCEKCSKVLKKNHICTPKLITDYPCKICGAYAENEVAWGYHMWKHTKDPKYIITPSSVKAKEVIKSTEVTKKSVAETPNPPEAHAVNPFSQVDQPLCLQTSGLNKEREVKPLDMQVWNSSK